MRLIDADYLKDVLNSGGGVSVDINISKKMPLGEIIDTVIQAYRKCLFEELEKMPTAYDVDKVVERLEEMLLNLTFHKDNDSKTWNKAIHKAVEIVKSGGIE